MKAKKSAGKASKAAKAKRRRKPRRGDGINPDWPPERVRALRMSRGQTIVVACAVAGVSRRTWIRWEQGHWPADQHVMDLYQIRAVPYEA